MIIAQSKKPTLAILAVAAAFLGSPAVASQDGGQGMLLLHSKAQNQAVDEALPRLEAQGCGLWRRGSVAATNGKLDVGSPDRFVLFVCEADVLDSAENRAALDPILSGGDGARAVEGPLVFRVPDSVAADAQQVREYIFKISSFNNRDPDGRARDLIGLNASASKRADRWQTEAVFSVVRAVGMETPDMVDVIFYDNPEQGERFRSQNKDILKQVGKFNKTHVEEFTYISGLPG